MTCSFSKQFWSLVWTSPNDENVRSRPVRAERENYPLMYKVISLYLQALSNLYFWYLHRRVGKKELGLKDDRNWWQAPTLCFPSHTASIWLVPGCSGCYQWRQKLGRPTCLGFGRQQGFLGMNILKVAHCLFFWAGGKAAARLVWQHLGKNMMSSNGVSHSTFHRIFELVAKDRICLQHNPRVRGIAKTGWIGLHNVEALGDNFQLRKQVSCSFFDLAVVEDAFDFDWNWIWVFVTNLDLEWVVE